MYAKTKTHVVLAVLLATSVLAAETPKLTVIFVIDQFAYHYLPKVKPYLSGGIKKILDSGLFYENAIFPHGMPSTPAGHAALSTGTYGCINGFTSYGRIDANDNYILITDDHRPESATFSPDGTYDYGCSPKSLMCDTLADQFVLATTTKTTNHAYGISFKARSAIPIAGHSGKAIWFDDASGMLTSSKAYFDTIPPWFETFRTAHRVKTGDSFTWQTIAPLSDPRYNSSHLNNYQYSSPTIINHPFTIDTSTKAPFSTFARTPFAHQLLLDAAKACLDAVLTTNSNNRLLLWISLSNFDFCGHIFGPDSLEQLDMIYRLDQQIADFLAYAKTIVPEKQTLIALTADHGVMPIPEILNKKSFPFPTRIPVNDLIQEMNTTIAKEFNIKNIVSVFEAPMFYLSKKGLAKAGKKRTALIKRLETLIESKPYIRQCWTNEELFAPAGPDLHYRKLFAKHIFKDRGGELILFLAPYQQLTKYPTGSSHATPYRYDVHVPLAISYKGHTPKTHITKPVSMLQLAGSLAKLIEIEPPSAAVKGYLPGIE